MLLLAEAEVLRVAATMSLLAFIALGVFALATPEFATEDRDEAIDARGWLLALAFGPRRK